MAGVVYACAVLLYKFEGPAYAAAQSVGAAVLYNRENNTSAILLYDSNKKPVCMTTITLDTYYNITSDVYVAIKDDQRQLWSIGFKEQEHQQMFSCTVLLCQRTYPLTGKKILKLQLPIPSISPTAKHVAAGEYVSIEYTCNEINNANPHALGVILSQSKGEPLIFKVGSGSVAKVFEDVLVGMKKGEKFYIIVPPLEPSKKKKKKVELPYEKSLFFTVTIIDAITVQEFKQKIKAKKEKSSLSQPKDQGVNSIEKKEEPLEKNISYDTPIKNTNTTRYLSGTGSSSLMSEETNLDGSNKLPSMFTETQPNSEAKSDLKVTITKKEAKVESTVTKLLAPTEVEPQKLKRLSSEKTKEMTIAAAVAKEAMQHTQEIKKEEDKIVSLKNVEVVKSPTKETTKSTSESTPHSEISVPTEPLSEEFRKELFDLSTAYKEKFLIKFKKSVSDMYKQFHEKLQDEQNSEELLTTIRSICLTFTQEVFAQANMKQAARDINEIQGAISAILNRLDTVQETALRLRDINNRLKQKLLQNNQTPGLSEVDQKLKDEIKAKDQLIKKYEVELKARDTEITTLKKSKIIH